MVEYSVPGSAEQVHSAPISPVLEQMSSAGFGMAQTSLVLEKISSFGIDGPSSPVFFESPNLTEIGEGLWCRRWCLRKALVAGQLFSAGCYHCHPFPTLPQHIHPNPFALQHSQRRFYTSSIAFFIVPNTLATCTAQIHSPPCVYQAVSSLVASATTNSAFMALGSRLL